jgi:hypothetical protein
MKSKTFKLTIEEERIIEGLRKSGGAAYEKALKNGVTVTVLHGNEVRQIQPDGKSTVVKKLLIGSKKAVGVKFKVK